MKKCVLLLFCLIPLYAFAGYRDIETAFAWIYLLLFVWGILNIILFFKIWGATNDIDKLKATICDKIQTTDKSDYLKKMYLLGNTDEAYDFLNEKFTDEIIVIYKECKKQSNSEGNIRFGDVSLPVAEVFERKKLDIVDKYSSDYVLLGRSIPLKLMEVKMEDLQNIG